nr:M14 metallopeptidase family protein [Saliniradius amylolyticus]
MKRLLMSLIFSLAIGSANAVSINQDTDYLPEGTKYDASIPTPASVLGYPVGRWHARHDQLVQYYQALAVASDRVQVKTMGYTHEQRPLLLLTISNPNKLAKLDDLRQQHLNSVERDEAKKDAPLVLWMGYSIHGDESSGANAAMLVAYYLAAALDDEVNQLLDETVIVMEPAINPDGLSRFAQWANMHQGQNRVADAEHREHQQRWPSGRTNHYWFDLNRDWLLLTHPESRARIAEFQQWRPHVLTDFHEMGTDSTYFFQPGVPSRKNPWTPNKNEKLTADLAEYHAATFDRTGQLYFSEEGFDDFYYGKGSTYPDAQGVVGILFEQASSRGHLQESIYGPLSFEQSIQNQVLTSLSTFEGALANKQELLSYQRRFDDQTRKLIEQDDLSGYLLSEADDHSRFRALLDNLRQHKIVVKGLTKDVKRDGKLYKADSSVFVPLNQPLKYRLIKSIFSTRKSFEDNTFYDVSNWNLPLAFNIDFQPVEKGMWRGLPLTDQLNLSQPTQHDLSQDAYAYAFSWQDSQAPALLQDILDAGIQAQLSQKAFSAETGQGVVSFEPGTVIIPKGLQSNDKWRTFVGELATQRDIRLWDIRSGLTPQGPDLGSRTLMMAESPQVLLVGGVGTSQYEVGELWYYFDQVVDMPVSIVDQDRLGHIRLADYSHIYMAEGRYDDLTDKVTEALESWLKQGGTLVVQKGAAKWASDRGWLKADFLDEDDIKAQFNTSELSYGDKDALSGKQRLAGSVFLAEIDTSHPLMMGYQESTLPFMRNSQWIMQKPHQPFTTVASYSDTPLLAGYASNEMEHLLAGKANIVAHDVGQGTIVGITDNLAFRGYWYGTRRILSNALFFDGFIDADG